MDYLTQQLGNELEISPQARFLKRNGMLSAALFYKNLNDVRERRSARITRWVLETGALPEPVPGQQLYAGMGYDLIYRRQPEDDPEDFGMYFVCDGGMCCDPEKLKKLSERAANKPEFWTAEMLRRDALAASTPVTPSRYEHGGLHYVPQISFALEHGFQGYEELIRRRLEEETDVRKRNFLEGMEDVLAGLLCFVRRSAEALAKKAEQDPLWNRMARAMDRISRGKPETFYEAVLMTDLILALTSYEPGRIDQYLYPFYQKDLEAGLTSKETAVSLFSEMFTEIDRNVGHPGVVHVTIGGTDEAGHGVYNDLTEAAILAIRGHRTPNLTLRIRRDMPKRIWDAALTNLGRGDTHPALYNDEMILNRLIQDYQIPYADAVNYVFGGCSELMIAGKSTCNSTWVAYNMLDILEQTMYNYLLSAKDFEDFYGQYRKDLQATVRELADHIRLREHALAVNGSSPLRCLLTDGCIAHGKGYLEGGSQYNFDSTNIYGGTNAVNSLYTIKLVMEGRLPFGREELLKAMAQDYAGAQKLALLCRRVPKFGNENEETEKIAREVMDTVFSAVMQENTWRGNSDYQGRFMPGIILWVDWVLCGEKVGATPDGRRAGEATVDSAGPMQGTDSKGPTASMLAALSVPQEKCAGTCVMNLRLDPHNFKTEQGRQKVRALIETYLAQGGCQLQINVVDGELLRLALKEPEKHRDIIVRVGGFSDNFVMLSSAIQQEILKRTEHSCG